MRREFAGAKPALSFGTIVGKLSEVKDFNLWVSSMNHHAGGGREENIFVHSAPSALPGKPPSTSKDAEVRWGPQGQRDIYSAPRKFDLAMLLAVTTAYAILFATIRFVAGAGLVNQQGPVIFWIGGLVTVVGFAQSVLFGGDKPREASALAGFVYGVFVMLGNSREFDPGGVVCLSIFSPGIGYLAGGLVGGVFLVADYLRIYIGFINGEATEGEQSDVGDKS